MRSFARSIVETVPQPLLLLDLEGNVRAANGAFSRVFNLEQSETIGRSLFALDRGQWDHPDLRAVMRDVQAGLSVVGVEVQHEGDRVLVVTGRMVFDDEGQAAIMLALEDVTVRVRAEQALQRLQRNLEVRVSERTIALETANQELEAFCYSVSHDLRAPLRAIDGFSEALLQSYADLLDDKGKHYLQRVRAGTLRMGELIDDLLRLSKVSRGEMHRVKLDLSALAESVVSDLSRQEPTRQVSVTIEPGLTGWGDRGLLKIVLENLLSNAWKFTRPKTAGAIAVGRATNGASTFFVRDNGAGFDMIHYDKLFGAFQRLHPQREFPGNGIGLATVQRVINRHGGRAWAEGDVDHGATFFFNLPSVESA